MTYIAINANRREIRTACTSQGITRKRYKKDLRGSRVVAGIKKHLEWLAQQIKSIPLDPSTITYENIQELLDISPVTYPANKDAIIHHEDHKSITLILKFVAMGLITILGMLLIGTLIMNFIN